MAGPSSASSPDTGGRVEAGISVWLSRLPADPDLAAMCRCLDAAELARLETLAPPRQREFGLSRWLIREALARVSGLAPGQCAPAAGRPVRSAWPEGLTLSLSHSHGVAACAISTGAAVGVDLEPLTRRPAWQQVARRWFTPDEQDWLLNANRHQDFLRVWTLKEAWLKATGRGIAGHLQTLQVSANGQLRGDDRRHPWRACVGTVADMMLAVAFSADPPLQRAPAVHWLTAPAQSASGAPAPDSADMDWWTATDILTEASDDRQ